MCLFLVMSLSGMGFFSRVHKGWGVLTPDHMFFGWFFFVHTAGCLKDSSEFKTLRFFLEMMALIFASIGHVIFLVWDVKHQLHNFQIFLTQRSWGILSPSKLPSRNKASIEGYILHSGKHSWLENGAPD